MLNLKFTDKYKKSIIGEITKLRNLHAKREYISPALESLLRTTFPELLGGFIVCLHQHTCFGSPFNRIVINSQVRTDKKNKRLHKFEQIKYLPEYILDKITYNRANLPKQSVFYAGYGSLTVALETKPSVGLLITESKWMQKKNTTVKYLPIFHKMEIINTSSEFYSDWIEYRKQLEKFDKNVALVVEELYDFIATVFTAEVNPNNKVEYIMSSLFSDIFMNDPKYNIDCIYYPSVQIGLITSNIAIKPSIVESHFDIEQITEQICTYSDEKNKKNG